MKLLKDIVVVVILTFTFCLAENKKKNLGVENVFTKNHLKEIRQELMYPFNLEDYQSEIISSAPQLHKNLDFDLPFYGFRYNYTEVSVNGYLQFTDAPETYNYPLKFPRNYPEEKDPAFIGPFYSKMRTGLTPEGSNDDRKNGVYFRVESNLHERTDKAALETRNRIQADIRDGGVIEAQNFEPKHVIIATWLRMSFQGGIDKSRETTNTFQVVVTTDEVSTYAMFNYADMNWSTHAEAGGDTVTGEGGIPAFVGFNAGQGKRSFEYHPYSQRFSIFDLTKNGCANGLKGRHIFRVDGKVIPGTCSNDMDYVCHLYLDQN